MKKAFKVFLWVQSKNEEDDEHVGENEDMEDDEIHYIIVEFNEVFYRRPCMIHTLQLLVRDCLKQLPARFLNILAKANAGARNQRNTHWNGQFRLLKNIEANFEEVRYTTPGIFVDSDLEPVQSITAFLSSFFFLTKQLESEKLTTV